jgi:MFS family permease
MPLPAPLRALNHRDFRLFFAGQLVSLIGTWMQSVGQAWLVLELTNSPLRLGLIGTLQFSPVLLLSFVSGAIVDRLPKRRLIVATQTALMVQAFGLAALVHTGHVQYWHVAVLATMFGIVNTFDMPARQAFIVDMVGKSDLMNAIALNSATFNGARMVGPAVAGLLVARYGVAPAFLLNGLSFLAVITALLFMRSQGLPHPGEHRSMREEIVEGIAYALDTPRVALTLSLVLAVSLFAMNYNVLVPLLARDVLHQQAGGFGVLMGAVGVGSLGGAVVLALLAGGRPPLSMLAVPAVAMSVAAIAVSGASQFWLAAVLLAVMGFNGLLFLAGANTTLQLTVPDRLRGRVMGLYMLVFPGVTPVGSLLSGSLAEVRGMWRARAAVDPRDAAPVAPDPWRAARRRAPSVAARSPQRPGSTASSSNAAAISARVYACSGRSKTRAAGPCSTTRPARMTTTSSASARTTRRSWLMNRYASR